MFQMARARHYGQRRPFNSGHRNKARSWKSPTKPALKTEVHADLV